MSLAPPCISLGSPWAVVVKGKAMGQGAIQYIPGAYICSEDLDSPGALDGHHPHGRARHRGRHLRQTRDRPAALPVPGRARGLPDHSGHAPVRRRHADAFRHYILETLSRCWALAHLDRPVDSVVFLTAGRRAPPEEPPIPDLLRILGISVPFRYVQQTTQVETLIVPRQGLGMGVNAAGLEAHRRFLREAFGAIPAKPTIPRRYISRRKYNLRRGGYLAEAWLEQELEAQGYVVFHPQEAPLEEQIATYRAAERIVSSDNSALHVVAMVGREDQRIAILLRRHYGAVDLFPQLSVAQGREPLVISAIQRVYCLSSRRPKTWGHYAEIDYPALFEALAAAGFVDTMPATFAELPRRVVTELYAKRRRFGGAYTTVTDAPADAIPHLQAPFFTRDMTYP